MSEEIRIDGIIVASGVLDTIVTLAAEGVDGVACVAGPRLPRVVQKSGNRGVSVEVAEDGSMAIALHINVVHGRPLPEIGAEVREAVAEAMMSQTGQHVSAVDVFVDAISFQE